MTTTTDQSPTTLPFRFKEAISFFNRRITPEIASVSRIPITPNDHGIPRDPIRRTPEIAIALLLMSFTLLMDQVG